MTERPVGLTRDAGWEIGVSRTFPVDPQTVWELLLSPAGLGLWLGKGISVPLTKGLAYRTNEGTTGKVRSIRALDRVRLTWQPEGRDTPATIQVGVVPAPRGCSVRFHTERLTSQQERETMREHWREVLGRLERTLR